MKLLWYSLILLLAGCTPRSNEPMSTGIVLPASALQGLKGDTHYGEIRAEWLREFYPKWKAELFKKGVVRWDARYDCNRFAGHLVSEVQIVYFVENFHSYTKGQAAAIGEVWYLKNGRADGAHAIVTAYTDRGQIYFEPQTGKELILSELEKRSIYYARF